MILASLGKLSTSQSLTAGATDSENVIELFADGSGLDYGNWTDVWLNIITRTVAGGAGSLLFDLVLAQEEALNNIVSVVRIYIAAETDKRVVTVGRNITAINVGKVMKDMLEEDGSDYEFIGLISTLGGSATITIDALLSFVEPITLTNKMQVISNVDNSIDVASDGSGA